MDFVRIGDKVVDRRRIERLVAEMLELRAQGLSQAEVASRLGVDRTLVSRLESLGEVRRGRTIAVVGFPVRNKEELRRALEEEGVDFIFLLTEEERWEFVREKSGLELVNTVMDLIARARGFDHVLVIGSNERIRIAEAVLGRPVIGFEIGRSPIREDKYVDPAAVTRIVRAIKL